MYDPNEEWNIQPCQMTRIHLRHPHIACAFFISYLYANEILCDFPSSGVIFIILLTIHAHSRVGVSPPKMGDTHFRTPVPADLPSFTDDDEGPSPPTRTRLPHRHTDITTLSHPSTNLKIVVNSGRDTIDISYLYTILYT